MAAAKEPRTPAEFRCIAMKAIDLENSSDPAGAEAALDEVVAMLERVYVGEQLKPTPCQKIMGRAFLSAVEEYLANQNEFMTIDLPGSDNDND